MHTFLYDDYVSPVWSYGAFLIVSALFTVSIAFIGYLRLSKMKEFESKESYEFKMGILVLFLIGAGFILLLLSSALYRGILLEMDKNQPEQYVVGTIERVTEVSKNFIPTDAGVSDYYIRDVAYPSFRIYSVKNGAHVKIGYLPNSKIVLSMEVLDE